jgi:hypothetical protein
MGLLFWSELALLFSGADFLQSEKKVVQGEPETLFATLDGEL